MRRQCQFTVKRSVVSHKCAVRDANADYLMFAPSPFLFQKYAVKAMNPIAKIIVPIISPVVMANITTQ